MKDAGTAGSCGVVRRTCVSDSRRRLMSAFVEVAVVMLVLSLASLLLVFRCVLVDNEYS